MGWSPEIREVASRITRSSKRRFGADRRRWFAVHVVLFVVLRRGPQPKRVHAWENIYVVKASDHKAARQLGHELAQEAAIDDPTFTWKGKPARWRVGGVRKTVECSLRTSRGLQGAEISYSNIELSGGLELRRFISGRPVKMLALD